MGNPRKVKANLILIWFIIGFMGMIEFFSSNCIIQITALMITYFMMVLSVKFDVFHPYVWFGGALLIYSIGYPVLYLLGANVTYGYTGEPLFMSWIAFVVILIVVPSYSIKGDIILPKRCTASKNLINVSSLYIICCIFMIATSGMANKTELYAQSNKLYSVAFSLVYLLLVFYTYSFCVDKCQKGKMNIILIIEVAIAAVGLGLFSGERDIMLNFVLVTVLLLYYWKVINIKQLMVLAVIGILLFPVTVVYKYYLLSGVKGTNVTLGFDLKSIIVNFFYGEFESASRNLQLLVNHQEFTKGLMGGRTYISAVTRIFGYAPWSCTAWFMAEFFEPGRSGQGFTAIGEGYINFGYMGIIFEFIIIGAMLSYMYKRHNRSITWLTIYISSFPIFIYAVRADLANILSPMCRHVLMGILVLKAYGAICCREKKMEYIQEDKKDVYT